MGAFQVLTETLDLKFFIRGVDENFQARLCKPKLYVGFKEVANLATGHVSIVWRTYRI